MYFIQIFNASSHRVNCEKKNRYKYFLLAMKLYLPFFIMIIQIYIYLFVGQLNYLVVFLISDKDEPLWICLLFGDLMQELFQFWRKNVLCIMQGN